MGFLFNRKKRKSYETAEEFEQAVIQGIEEYQNKINAQLYAEFLVINYISKEFAKSKIIFYEKNNRKDGEEFYRWNVKPNCFQTAFEFKYDIASQLILNNEVLIFEKGSDLIVADYGFTTTKKGISEYVFSNVSKEDEKFLDLYKSSDVIYLKYDENDIKHKLGYLLSGMQELITTAASNYEITANQKGILELESWESGSGDFQQKVDDLLNNRFKKFFQSKKNAVLPLYKGMKYQDINSERSSTKKSEIADVNSLIDEMIAKAAISHGVMPSAILGDKEDTTEAERATISKAIKPIADLLVQGINGSKIIEKNNFISGTYAEVDLSPLTYTTIFDNAENSDVLLRSSQFNVDELRMARGMKPLNTWWSRRYFGTKNYELISLKENSKQEGGE